MEDLAKLFARFRDAGDLEALGLVFDATAPRLLSLALHLCGEPSDAEDALQATFLVAIRKASSFDESRAIESWLAGILTGEARNLARRKAHRRNEEAPDVTSPAISPEDHAARRELIDQIRTRVDKLPEDQRQVVLLQLEHGLAPAEIAEVLGVKPGAVRMRLHRALATLRRLLPASLGGALVGALPSRGLAAVRQAVLAEARSLAPAAVAGAGFLGGVLVTKKLLVPLVVVAALAVAYLAAPRGSAPRGVGSEEPTVVAADTADSNESTFEATPDESEQGAALPERRATARSGDLVVQVRFADRADPVVDARVGLWPTVAMTMSTDSRPWSPDPEPPIQGQTDPSGVARFVDLPLGEFRVEVEPRKVRGLFDRPDPVLVLIVPGEETALELTVECGTVVEGVTIDERGAPVGGAEILTAWSQDAPLLRPSEWRHVGRSDAGGRFRILLIHGENQVAARAPGFGPSPTHVVPTGGATPAAPRIVLPSRRGALIGSVIDARGAPIEGVSVVVSATTGRNDERAPDGAELLPFAPFAVRSDALGTFELRDLAVDEHRVLVHAAGYARVELAVLIGDGGTERLTIVLEDAASLSGIVRDREGLPVPEARVDVEPARPGEPRSEAVSGADGRFAFDSLRPGPLTVRATRFGLGRAARELELRAGIAPDIELVLEPREGLSGRLVDPGGRSLAGWTVQANDPTWKMTDFRDRERFRATVTDTQGRFSLPDLGPFRFDIVARNGTIETATDIPVAEDVAPSADPITLVVPATEAATVYVVGRVVGPTGAPIAGARVRRTDPESRRGPRWTHTDDDGSFEIGPGPSGSYVLTVEADRLLARTLPELRLAPDERRDIGEVHLQAGARLEVALVHTDGRPWAETWPALFVRRSAEGVWTYFNGHYFDDRRNVVMRDAMEPGTVLLQVREDRLLSWPVRVDLTDGVTTSVALTVLVAEPAPVHFVLPDGVTALRIPFRVTDDSGRVLLEDEARVRSDGSPYELMLPPGRWRLEAGSDAGPRYAATLTPPLDEPVLLEPIE